MKNKKNIWFKAKRYGWGWRPASWQGWVIAIIYILGLVNYAMTAESEHSGSDFLLAFATKFIPLTLVFLAICYLKGERPRWHWGK